MNAARAADDGRGGARRDRVDAPGPGTDSAVEDGGHPGGSCALAAREAFAAAPPTLTPTLAAVPPSLALVPDGKGVGAGDDAGAGIKDRAFGSAGSWVEDDVDPEPRQMRGQDWV